MHATHTTVRYWEIDDDVDDDDDYYYYFAVTAKSNLFQFIFKMTITYGKIYINISLCSRRTASQPIAAETNRTCVFCACVVTGQEWSVLKRWNAVCACATRQSYDILMTMMKRISTLNMFFLPENMWKYMNSQSIACVCVRVNSRQRNFVSFTFLRVYVSRVFFFISMRKSCVVLWRDEMFSKFCSVRGLTWISRWLRIKY